MAIDLSLSTSCLTGGQCSTVKCPIGLVSSLPGGQYDIV